ncbi:hypothetical protein B0O99DRAFT_158040 [Bisporella sp. PMI_857]|nr:hypothetical protein B0O99DRAFT_158040 [Bisporella sp. PMI_857]
MPTQLIITFQYPVPTDVHSRSSGSKRTKSTAPTSASSKSRRSSAYDNDFEQHLIDNKVYPNNRKSKPGKSTGLYQILSNPRPSLSPSRFSDNAFEDFQQKGVDLQEIARQDSACNPYTLEYGSVQKRKGFLPVDRQAVALYICCSCSGVCLAYCSRVAAPIESYG